MAGKNRIGKRPPSPNAPITPLQRVLNESSTYRLAFYRGSRAQQRRSIEELREAVEHAGRKVITFNCQRYARQDRIWPLMVQSLVLRIKELAADHIELEPKVEGLLLSLDEIIDGQLSQSRKVRLLESLDHELENILEVVLAKPPLVVIVKGLGTLEPKTMVELVEFISGSLEIRRLCFVMGLHESAIAKGLDDHYHGQSPLTAREFLEESFPVLMALGPPEPEAYSEKRPIVPERDFEELPAPIPQPVGLPEPALSGQLFTIYPDPQLREKLISLQRLTPQIYWVLDRDPGTLLILERLTRGDNSPSLQHQLAASETLRTAFAEPTVRAVLVKPPYFDPTPLELDRMGSVAGLRMVSNGPSFDMPAPEPRGLESENGSSIQARLTNNGSNPELEVPAEPPALPAQIQPEAPRPRSVKKKIVAKKIMNKTGVKTRPDPVKRPVRQVKSPRKPKVPVSKQPLEKSVARPRGPPPKATPAVVEMEVEETLDAVRKLIELVESGDIPAVRELAGKQLSTMDVDELEELAKVLFKLTHEGSNRVKAAAAFALGLLGGRISQRTAQTIKDRLLTLTAQSHREVREEAAKALTSLKKGQDTPPPSPPPAAFKTVEEGTAVAGKRPTFGVVSKPPARDRAPSFAVVQEDRSTAVSEGPKDGPTFAIVEDDPKPTKASFSVVKDTPPQPSAPSFAVVDNDRKAAAPAPPKSQTGATPGFSVVKDEPQPAKASFSVVKDEAPKAPAPSFSVVTDEAPASSSGFALPRPIGKTSDFKVVGEDASVAPSPLDPTGTGKRSKKGFQVVN